MTAYQIIENQAPGQTANFTTPTASNYGQVFTGPGAVFSSAAELQQYLTAAQINAGVGQYPDNVKNVAKTAYDAGALDIINQYKTDIASANAVLSNDEALINLAAQTASPITATPNSATAIVNTLATLNLNGWQTINSRVTTAVQPLLTSASTVQAANNATLSATASDVASAQSKVNSDQLNYDKAKDDLPTQLANAVATIQSQFTNVLSGTAAKSAQLNWVEAGYNFGLINNLPIVIQTNGTRANPGTPIAEPVGPDSNVGLVLRYMIQNNIPVPGLPSTIVPSPQMVPLTASQLTLAQNLYNQGIRPHFITDVEYLNGQAQQGAVYQAALQNVAQLKLVLEQDTARLASLKAVESIQQQKVNNHSQAPGPVTVAELSDLAAQYFDTDISSEEGLSSSGAQELGLQYTSYFQAQSGTLVASNDLLGIYDQPDPSPPGPPTSGDPTPPPPTPPGSYWEYDHTGPGNTTTYRLHGTDTTWTWAPPPGDLPGYILYDNRSDGQGGIIFFRNNYVPDPAHPGEYIKTGETDLFDLRTSPPTTLT